MNIPIRIRRTINIIIIIVVIVLVDNVEHHLLIPLLVVQVVVQLLAVLVIIVRAAGRAATSLRCRRVTSSAGQLRRCLDSLARRHHFGGSKVRYQRMHLLVQQNILRLQIPMHDVASMHMFAGEQQLGSVVASAGGVEAADAIYVGQEIALAGVCHHEVEGARILEGAREIHEARHIRHHVHHFALSLNVILLVLSQDQTLLAHFDCKENK